MTARARDTALEINDVADDDLSGIDALLADGFGVVMQPQPTHATSSSNAVRLLARRAGKLAGYVAAHDYGSVAYVGPMAVTASARRQGIGSALLSSLLATLDARGCATILLDATTAGAALYATLGFVTADETGIFRRDGDRIESVDGSAIESDALRSAITFDAAILGCDRSLTLRELASERGARLVVDPAGYLLTRRGIVGPWLATSAAAAARLFARARQPTSQLALAYVPRSNVAAVDIATGAGFVLDRTLLHMRRGAPSPMRRDAIFGQASLALG